MPEHCNPCLHSIYPGLLVAHVQVARGGWQSQPEPHILAGHAVEPQAPVAFSYSVAGGMTDSYSSKESVEASCELTTAG